MKILYIANLSKKGNNPMTILNTPIINSTTKSILLQENLEVMHHTKVLHPSVEDYFENFDGSQYLPRPWLR